MRREAAIVAVGALACFTAGAATPWLAASDAEPRPGGTQVPMAAPTARSTPSAEARAPAPRARGILAIGDETLHVAGDCLTQAGIRVHPRIIRSVEELATVVSTASAGYAAVLVQVSTLEDLVDGHIEVILDSAAPRTRVVWATIRMSSASWEAFSPEDRINASIRNVVARDPDARVLDWRSASDRHPDWQSDAMLPSSTGCSEFTAKAIKLAGRGAGG